MTSTTIFGTIFWFVVVVIVSFCDSEPEVLWK